jgi:predicted enzyme related to lactoylglutathione lyase
MAAYATGEFCWYELGARDIDAAVKFYKELARWGTMTQDMGDQGVYYIFQLEGQDVGGGYQMSGPQFEGVPPHWMPYVWVDDVDAVVAKAGQLGGKVIAPAMDVPNVGRMAFLQDPQGAHFAVFKGKEHQGAARLSPKPGTFCWTELLTTSAADGRRFYEALFGWTHAEMPMAGGATYTVFQVNGKPAAGMMQMEGPQFQGVPPNWLSYLSVGDCDAEVARAGKMGAEVLVPPQDVPNTGRFSVLQDPTGTVFAIIALVPMK